MPGMRPEEAGRSSEVDVSMILMRRRMVKYESSRRYVHDQRVKKAWAVFKYVDADGEEYRRAFWADRGTSRTEFDLIAPMTIQTKSEGK